MSARKPKELKPFPSFRTDEEAEHFVDSADLSDYDFSQFQPARFDVKEKEARVSMHMPRSLFEAIKKKAEAQGVSYQRFIRSLLEKEIGR